MEYRKKFICLDLETTHLDMEEGRIMEVGAVEVEIFWNQAEQAVKTKFGRRFQSLVNPEIEASPVALMLTGIEPGELEEAPAWKEIKVQFSEFLSGGERLLGHNVLYDLEFLKHQGLALKNASLDSLELAQTLMPLLRSHSLEYLAERFELSEGVPHRALEDSMASGRLVVWLLNEFLANPSALQNEIKDYLRGSKLNFADLILDLPESEIKSKIRPVPEIELGEEKIPFAWKDKTIFCLPLAFNKQQEFLNYLANSREGGIAAVSKRIFLDFIPEDQKIVPPSWALCEKRLEFIKSREGEDPILAKIFIKIAILRANSGSLDLSRIKWAYSERDHLGKFTADRFVCPAHQCAYIKSLEGLSRNKVYFLDLASLFDLVMNWEINLGNRRLLLFDLAEVEDNFTGAILQTWNLKKIRQSLAILDQSDQEVETLANELDLFFGILHLVYLKREGEFAEALIVDEQEAESVRFRKLFHPATKLTTKLKDFLRHLEQKIILEGDAFLKDELLGLEQKIKALILFLENFFLDGKENHLWLKFNHEWVDLNLIPQGVENYWSRFSKNFSALSVVDTMLPKISFDYFVGRLGMADFKIQKYEAAKPKSIRIKIFDKPQTKGKMIEWLKGLPGRILVVLPNERELELYLEKLYEVGLKDRIFSLKHSGSVNLIKTKLTTPNAVLLLTTNMLVRFFPTLPEFEKLLILRLPFEAPGRRPALAMRANFFKDHVLPRGIHVLHAILSKFASSGEAAGEVFIADPRILTEYDKAFMRYLEEVSDFQISTVDMP